MSWKCYFTPEEQDEREDYDSGCADKDSCDCPGDGSCSGKRCCDKDSD